jgi:ribosome-associated protein
MEPQILNTWLIQELEEIKALEILNIDVAGKTTIADNMIICTANSARHAKAVCKHVQKAMKEKGVSTQGLSGDENGDWIIMDFGSNIIHIMQAQTRAFYHLEGIWQQNDLSERPANES